MSDSPRYYKWFPTTSCDLGTMPFEGDWTVNDRIGVVGSSNLVTFYSYNQNTNEFGKYVTQKVGGRTRTVWTPGVQVVPTTLSATGEQAPVWFAYYGDGVCVAKLPEGEVVEAQS